MLINADEINKVLSSFDSDTINKGKKYFEQDRVKIANFYYKSDEDYTAECKVDGTYYYNVMVKKEKGKLIYKCNCPAYQMYAGHCKHIIAVLFDLYINGEKYLNFKPHEEISNPNNLYKFSNITNNKNYISDDIIQYYEILEFGDVYEKNVSNISVLPRLSLELKNLNLSFKIGNKRMYILKDLEEFYDTLENNRHIRYGKELEFKNQIECYNENSKDIVKFIKKVMGEYRILSDSISGYYNCNNKLYKSQILLKNSYIDDFFDIAKNINNGTIEIENYDIEYKYISLVEEDPVMKLKIEEKSNGDIKIGNIYDTYFVFNGDKYSYILKEDKLHRCSNEYQKYVIPILNEFNKKYRNELLIEKVNCTSFFEYALPHVTKFSDILIEEKLTDKYKAQKLGVKVYLDVNKSNDIIGTVRFCYDDISFNPFIKENDIDINRNMLMERRAKEQIFASKFNTNIKNGTIILSNENDIYNFLTSGIKTFMEKFEVLVTEKFKSRQVVTPKVVSIGVKVENNLLNLEFSNLDISRNEMSEILSSYKMKKKYFRLKSGNFIDLESSGIGSLINIVDNLGISESKVSDTSIKLPLYRATYLEKLVENDNNIIVSRDSQYKKIVNDILNKEDIENKVPKCIESILRPYQVRGYNWLKIVDRYNLGGILADDMGLGKTIQIITLLIDEKINDGDTSIVVCPSSLYINWQKEIEKFAPNINTIVISGDAPKREELIKRCKDYDVVITSYDLLKRDIENYKNFNFRYIIADEAQYIKNNNTKNSKALKALNGKTRFALTGTPMENSLSELWSIFDFIMPGYLFGYKKFREKYEIPAVKENDKCILENLRKMVAPFILRRIKKEVLTELPDKTETVMYSKMNEEQEKIYKAYLAKAKEDIKTEIDKNGFENSRIKILSIITRLRQICCHPSLFLEDYNTDSSKLIQCIEIVENAISSKHKVLIFSQFASMLDLIKCELTKRAIKYYILTGSTKVDTRVQMVDDFNKSDDVYVFLISLKAGGTGLNLTGADMVIHYDPWWNISAQNQATDRAYRIGQKNNVQVFKLISQDSIEEKIKELQDKKSDLTNLVIKEGENFINKMTKEDIMNLFD